MKGLTRDIFNANIKEKSTRQGFGDALLELGEINDKVVVLNADLEESLKVKAFSEKYPKRFIEVGVAEQNMVGIGAGLALSGKIPFVTSFAVFNPGRNWEQIRLSVAYTNANVKIVGSHSGFSDGPDGATHQALEDIALTRVLPNMSVLVPADYEQTRLATLAAAKIKGPVYLRLTRNDSPVFTTSDATFEIGKAQILNEGKDVSIMSCGPITYEVLLAARELGLKHRIDVEVINLHTVKPLDIDAVVKSAKKTGKVVTVEEHQINGGLGGTVSEVLGELHHTKILRIGAKDTFGESGTYEDLIKKYELDHASIAKRVLKFIKE